MSIVANEQVNLNCIRNTRSFSRKHIGLIKRAYPFIRGADMVSLCEKIDQYVSLKLGNDVSAEEFLKGRVFGLTGVDV